VAAGTVDADSNLDIASLDSESSQVIVLRRKKDGTFGSARRFQSGKSATTIALADFNGDGKTDIVTDNNAGISILIGNGNGEIRIKIMDNRLVPQTRGYRLAPIPAVSST